ncbi:hypothetical protein AB0M28_19225 [Streptomyces sp. NPDC051940]|uniref:hypothetical protein n=1 Tax=Streptomyces sp. NPDC051940 TaxID=3155675 RepID=UPI0034495AF0
MDHRQDPEADAGEAAAPEDAAVVETPPDEGEPPGPEETATAAEAPAAPLPHAPVPPPLPPAAQDPAQPSLPDPAAPRRRRGKTTLLIACALVLGAVAGVCQGYVTQADLEPTPLPPLAQAKLGVDEAAVVSGEDAPRDKAKGDLRKLLLPMPKGSRLQAGNPKAGAWLPAYEVADHWKDPEWAFEHHLDAGFQRCAIREWERGHQETDVWLVQFRDELAQGARGYADGQLEALRNGDWEHSRAKSIPGSATGQAFVLDKPQREPGYLPYYEARAVARRGNVVMLVFISDSKPISSAQIMKVAKQQLERL